LPRTLYENLAFDSVVSSTSISYQEELALHYPLIWATGGRYALSNDWTLFVEGDLIGVTQHGYLLSYNTLSTAFGGRSLQEKGRNVAVEPHWGARYQFTEKATAHFGGYYESSRWAGLPGLLHTSGGISYKFGELVEVIGGLDVAKNSTQFVFTFR
jgi:hypothetical protein